MYRELIPYYRDIRVYHFIFSLLLFDMDLVMMYVGLHMGLFLRLIGSVLWLKEFMLCEFIIRYLSLIVLMRIKFMDLSILIE